MHSTDSQYLDDVYPDLSDTYSERRVDADAGSPNDANRQKPGRPYRASRNDTQIRDAQSRSDKSSTGRQVVRSISFFLFAVLVGVSGTLACLSYSDEVAQVFPPFGWLSGAASTTKASPPPAVTAADLQEQLKPVAIDIALVRRSIEQLTSNLDQLARKQDQLGQNMATLQAAEQELSQKVSVPQPAPKAARASLSAPKPLQPPPQ
ncbi:MAG TPA: hypothetical protein VGU64_00905 [Terriglobales bacterium]|jgi:hypothetical protein|nr:hypothetical protein [Terriglobales bacterium]